MALGKDIKESIKKSLVFLLDKCELEDLYIRQRMLREAKQLELYWHGFQFIFWDEREQDFRIPTHEALEELSTREDTKYIYDYVVNVFKAHGLSIIAALSADVPSVPFSPRNPDEIEDVLAAKKAEELGKVIMKANRAKLLFYHALFTLYTNHYVLSYNYYERDKKYGTTDIPNYKKKKIKGNDYFQCEDCGFITEEKPESGLCKDCAAELTQKEGEEQEQMVQDGTKEENLGMSKIRVRGTLNTKIPLWAADQDACGYIIDYYDQHYSYLRYIYPDLRDKIDEQNSTDNFERIMRMPTLGRLYSDTYLSSLQTLKRVWLRPHMFEMLDKEDAKELKDEYPNGVHFAYIGDTNSIDLLAEAEPSNMDDCWTIAKGDLSRAVHGDPLGKPALGLQDVENMVTNLMIESMEHSIPSTFADPEILDFDKYSHQEVVPGAVYPTKEGMSSQKAIGDYFYTLQTSTLPKESVDFDAIVQSKTQFVLGAFPSIFGGPQTEGSKTLGEYQESRSYALQRLSIPYQMLFFWWADTIYKGVKIHIVEMIDEEVHTSQNIDGKYVCVKLLADYFTKGRFNQVIPESAVDLPVSFSQKKSTLQQMIQLNNDTLMQYLFSPENRRITLRYLGMEEFSDMDSNQSIKQMIEIDEMQTGPVGIDQFLDDHDIHLRIIKNFASSAYGQEVRKDMPEWYNNMMQHGQLHYQALQDNIAMQQQKQAEAQLLKNTKVRTDPSTALDQIKQETNPQPPQSQQQPNLPPNNQPVGVQ